MPGTVFETHLEGLKLWKRGKVRDIWKSRGDLLIVTTDRVSAFDVVLPTPIPGKGHVLTALTLHWIYFLYGGRVLKRCPLIGTEPELMDDAVKPHAELLRGRCMLVRKAKVFPVECVVRGYLVGSGWKEYKESGTVCGIKLPPGLREADRLPEPIFTPTTKAESGHDQPLTFEQVKMKIGSIAEEIRDASILCYKHAAAYARKRGIIIADTKFEWGLIDGKLFLVDEVLTPDSSRFWPADKWKPGSTPPSFDKQPLRDWLEGIGWNKQPPAPELPATVVKETAERYQTALRLLMGQALQENSE
jgi:phosphoribosylaminoimidazole-succinocarboxamide synthase